MVPLDNLVTVADSAGPPVITHYNLFRAVEIDGSAAPGYSSGQALAGMEELATAKHDARHELTSGPASRSTRSSPAAKRSSSLRSAFWSCISRYRRNTRASRCRSSFCLAVPMAVLGALGLVSLRGLANDVYCQIGLVMLIGLSAKNSILIVEFAEQLRRKGRSIAEAAIEAGELRLRPILMTSFAFILGVLPLVFATGAGALGRRQWEPRSWAACCFPPCLNLVFIPVLYVILSRLLRRGDAVCGSGGDLAWRAAPCCLVTQSLLDYLHRPHLVWPWPCRDGNRLKFP